MNLARRRPLENCNHPDSYEVGGPTLIPGMLYM